MQLDDEEKSRLVDERSEEFEAVEALKALMGTHLKQQLLQQLNVTNVPLPEVEAEEEQLVKGVL